jgi:hypothetical protein
MAVNGTFIINVVGYDRYKTCAPSFLTIVLSASNALLNFLVAAGPVVLLLLLEILFILILLLLLPPPIPSPLIAFTSLGQFPPNCICILCFTVSNGVCTASPTIVANAPALASATNSPYADDDDDDDDDPIGFKRNIFFPYSYVAKYTACAGPAPNPPATTPRYRPFTPSVFKIDRIAFGIVLLIIFIELVLLLLLVKEEEEEAEEEEEEDAAAATSCIRVFTVSTGNITVCSIVPANAPANMCCVYSIDDFVCCCDDDEGVVFMVVFVVVFMLEKERARLWEERKMRLLC